jgi:hypothetical protein
MSRLVIWLSCIEDKNVTSEALAERALMDEKYLDAEKVAKAFLNK